MAQKTLAAQASKAQTLIKQVALKCGGLMPSLALNLFDKMVVPILTYGAEIWGCNVHVSIERVQTKCIKWVLGLPWCTPNTAIYGECGRLPLKVLCTIKTVKYWLKLIHLPTECP